MTVRNLQFLLRPRSLAVIGASADADALGHIVLENIKETFRGAIYPVNRRHSSVLGLPAYADVKSLPVAPDLAVVVTPADTVPQIITDLGERGCRAGVVLSAGFGEGGDGDGVRRREAALAAAKPHLFRILGPNCLGVMSPAIGLNASFSRTAPLNGHIALVAQSGAVAAAMIDWARPRGIGFSHIVSLGDMIDVDFGDMLDYLCNDQATHAILLYVEGLTHPQKFMSAARAAARIKPVLAIKTGRTAESAKVAASHTGALAGSDAVYDAVFARAGVLRVDDIEDLFGSAALLSLSPPVTGDRLAIITNGGGFGVLAADRLAKDGGHLATLSATTLAALDEILPKSWSHANPVDVIGDATSERYAAAMRIVLADSNADALLTMHCPTAVADPLVIASAVAAEAARAKDRAVLTSWVGGASVGSARTLLSEQKIPTFDTPSEAIRGFMDLARFRKLRDGLMEAPPIARDISPNAAPAGTAILQKHAIGWLEPAAVRQLLSLYGFSFPRSAEAASPEEAAAVARNWNCAVALKISSPDVVHKSDVGGVALNLTPTAVAAAATAMLANIARSVPNAQIRGFVVEEMIARPHAQELILGMTRDPTFGPVIVFGHGGVAVEAINDKAIGLPPLNLKLAQELIGSTRIARLLAGYRDHPPAQIAAVADALVALSQIIIDHPEIAELDINPLLADENGVMALDARIKIAPPNAPRLIIRPYPRDLERTVIARGGGSLMLSPIKPEDGAALRKFLQSLSPDDMRFRFFAPLQEVNSALSARLSQIDYDREIALIAYPAGADRAEMWGVARFHADPDDIAAEFAIAVRSNEQNQGVGHALMTNLIQIARTRGIAQLWGDVLADNSQMLALCDTLGMRRAYVPEEPGCVRVSLDLNLADRSVSAHDLAHA